MFNQPYELQWETVAVPLVEGLDLRTRARLVKPTALLRALNVRFPRNGGPEKRSGHRVTPARAAYPYPPGVVPEVSTDPAAPDPYNTDREQPDNWLFGYGLFDPIVPQETSFPGGYVLGDPADATASTHPHAGVLFGALTRDDEAAAWDGHRLFPYVTALDDGRTRPITAVVPWARTYPIARDRFQDSISGADNGSIRVVAWLSGGDPIAQVFDSVTGAAMTGIDRVAGLSAVDLKVVPVGDWIHMYALDDGANTVELYYRRADSNGWSHATIGDASNMVYDVRVVNDNKVLVVYAEADDVLKANYVTADGQVGSPMNLPVSGAVGDEVKVSLACAVHGRTGHIGIVWGSTTRTLARVYAANGFPYAAQFLVEASQPVSTTIADIWLDANSAPGEPRFRVFWEGVDTSDPWIKTRVFHGATLEGSGATQRYHLKLGTQAIRTGQRTHVVAYHPAPFQSTWFLLDDGLLPEGRWNIGTAFQEASTYLPPLNWRGSAPAKDRVVYHTCLAARTRLDSRAVNANDSTPPPPAYTEQYPVWVDLDFLPPLRSVQAGRTVYIPGAQLWGYDGSAVHEAGFPLFPETIAAPGSNGAGALTAAGKYTYRVDLCHKNRRGEEVRSASIFIYTDGQAAPTALQATHNTVTLTGDTVPTRHTDSYFLIWRNENNGTLWYLLNSRDPSSADFRGNDTATRTWTFTDLVSDASLTSGREIHPAQSDTYINPFPAPACEVIAAGRDRVWVAGGEVPPGTVSPSRLFSPGERASFSPVLEILVDRSGEAVTAIGHVGDVTAVFRESSISALDSDGPDNNFLGAWSSARPIVTDVGAVTQESLARTTSGLVFQALGGFRLLGPGGQVSPVGAPVDLLARTLDIAATVVEPDSREVRFYGRTGRTLVVSYEGGEWSEWTCTAFGAVRSPVLGVFLARPRGDIWIEDEDMTTDGGRGFEYLVRTGWFGGDRADFVRVRRAAMFGEFLGHHKATVRFFYNDRDYPAEEFTWLTSDDLVNGAWGDGDWGSGMWGDPLDTDRDSVWRWRRRTARQKCSSFSVEISDNGATGRSFTPVLMALEIGRRGGVDRVPARTFGD